MDEIPGSSSTWQPPAWHHRALLPSQVARVQPQASHVKGAWERSEARKDVEHFDLFN